MVHSCRSTLFLTERLTDQSAARARERPTGFHSLALISLARSLSPRTERNAKVNYYQRSRDTESICSRSLLLSSRSMRSSVGQKQSELPSSAYRRTSHALDCIRARICTHYSGNIANESARNGREKICKNRGKGKGNQATSV